jgi:two-component system response regulator ResD
VDRTLDVLLVEDDAPVAHALGVNLRVAGFEVRWSATGDAALDACAERRPDVVVLDVMLPDRSGLDVCVAIRRAVDPAPGIVMLTARSSEADVVLGLDHGADDYVVKPCRPRELIARVRAVARRAQPRASADAPMVLGRIRAEPSTRRAFVGDRELVLTPTEHELLVTLLRQPGTVISRMELLKTVFDSSHAGYARNVDCHVARLRRKLEEAGLEPAPIKTIYRVGYRMELA